MPPHYIILFDIDIIFMVIEDYYQTRNISVCINILKGKDKQACQIELKSM